MCKVLAEGVLQMSLFAETLAEVEDQGRRYALPKNEQFEGPVAQVEC
jgi:DNA-binding transcriptional regulator of glucitol operon